jgi:hypothetical protein
MTGYPQPNHLAITASDFCPGHFFPVAQDRKHAVPCKQDRRQVSGLTQCPIGTQGLGSIGGPLNWRTQCRADPEQSLGGDGHVLSEAVGIPRMHSQCFRQGAKSGEFSHGWEEYNG